MAEIRASSAIDWDDERGRRLFEAMRTAPQRMARALRVELLAYMRRFVSPAGTWGRAYLRGRPGLYRRSGDLARSFEAVDESTSDTLEGIQTRGFTRSRYARIHQFGGVITARNGRRVRSFHLPDGSEAVGRSRTPMLTWKGTDGRWYSKRQVTIPARLHFLESFREDAVGRAAAIERAFSRFRFGDGSPAAPAGGA